MLKVFKYFAFWRIFLFIPVFIAGYFISLRVGYLYSNPWANFDGVHYLSIAARGYITQAAFFPLFPLLIKIFSFGHWFFLSGFFVSNIAFFLSIFYLYKLLSFDYKAQKVWEIIVFLLVFPTSIFFGAVYSESIFFLLLVLTFYFARKENWAWATISAALLSVTRLVGILILPALIYEYYVQKKKFNSGLLIIPIFFVAYSVFNYFKWGDILYFIHVHGQLANGRDVTGIILFPQILYRYAKILLGLPIKQFEWWIASLELLSFLAGSYLLFIAWRKKVRTSYLIFSILAFLLPASSGTFSGLPRYLIILFPIFIAMSFLNDKIKLTWKIISLVLLIILTMYFSRGYFVAYELFQSITLA